MDKHTLLYSRYIDSRGGVMRYLVRILIDTIDDLPEPQEKWAPGSVAFILLTGKSLMLNNKREWVQVDNCCSAADTYTAAEIDEKLAKISSGGADVASDDEVTDMLEGIFGQ